MSLTKINLNMIQTPISGVLAGTGSINHASSFIIGNEITTTAPSALYVNDLRATGLIYGDGRYISNIGLAFTNRVYMNAALSGVPTTPTPDTSSRTFQIANTEYVKNDIEYYLAHSPYLSGSPSTITPVYSSNDFSIPNTQWINSKKYIQAASKVLTDDLAQSPQGSVSVGRNSLASELSNSTQFFEGVSFISDSSSLTATFPTASHGIVVDDLLRVTGSRLELDNINGTYVVSAVDGEKIIIPNGSKISETGTISAQKTERANIAIGPWALDNLTVGGDNIGIGFVAGHGLTTGDKSVAIGNRSSISDNDIVVGIKSSSAGSGIVVGNLSTSTGEGVSLGHSVTVNSNSVAIGNSSTASSESNAIGYSSYASSNSIASGKLSKSTNNGIAIGLLADASDLSVSIGNTSKASTSAVSLGYSASASNLATSIGYFASASNINVAVGPWAIANSNLGAIALGPKATASSNHLAIGSSDYPLNTSTSLGGRNFEIKLNNTIGYIPVYENPLKVFGLEPKKRSSYSSDSLTGTVNFDIINYSYSHYSQPAVGNFVLNVRGNSDISLNDFLSLYEAVNVTFYYNNEEICYSNIKLQIDGVDQYILWKNNATPTPNVRCTNVYTYEITKVGNNIFTVRGSLQSFSNYDPYLSTVSLLLHGNGSQGSQVIVDSSFNNLSVNTFGNAQIDTSIKVFGSGSIKFDGNGDYLTLATNELFNFGTGPFTLETWIYISQDNNQTILLLNSNAVADLGAVQLNLDSSRNLSLSLKSVSSSGYAVTSGPINAGLALNTWHHLAITRDDGGTIRLFRDGVQIYGTVWAGNLYADGTTYIGSSNNSNSYFNGYLEDIRFTKGICRYNGLFALPLTPHPDI